MKHCHQLLTVLVLFFVVQKTTGLCKEDERKLRCVEDLSCRLKQVVSETSCESSALSKPELQLEVFASEVELLGEDQPLLALMKLSPAERQGLQIQLERCPDMV